MNRLRFVWNLVFLFGLFLQPLPQLFGQKVPYIQFTAEDGLPSSNVYRVMEDREGFLWVPTDAGVARFDGRQFEVFTREEGLTNNDVLNIAEDSQGRIWLMTLAGGLCYFKDGRIVNPQMDPVLARGPRNSFVSFMFEDSRNRLWFSTMSDGVYCLDGDQMRHYKLIHDEVGASGGAIWEDPEGRIYLRLYQSICQLYPEHKEVRSVVRSFSLTSCNLPLPEQKGVLIPDIEGHVWFHNSTKDSIAFRSKREFKSNSIKMLADSTIWLSSSDGGIEMFAFDAGSGQWKLQRELFPDYEITSVARDGDGNTWFSTRGDGILMIRPQEIFNFSGPNGNGVRHIFRDSTGHYWYATSDHRLARSLTTSLTGDCRIFPLFLGSQFNGFIEFPGRKISAFGPGILTLRSYEIKKLGYVPLKRFPIPAAGEFPVTVKGNVIHFVGTGSAKKAVPGADGSLLVASNTGLFKILPKAISNNDVIRLENGRFSSIAHGENGDIWVGRSSGLYLYRDCELISYRDLHSAFSNAPEDILFHPATGLWVATNGQGTLNLDLKTNEVTSLSEENGLAGNLCSRIYAENDDYLWIATKRGLSRIDLRADFRNEPRSAIHSLTHSEGLIDNDVTSILLMGDTVIAATPRGISVFHKKEMDYVMPPPKPFWRGIRVAGKDYNPDSSLSLSYRDNSPSFYFAGLSLGSLGKGTFRYRLDPIEDDWHETSQPEATYNQLPPGDYNFRMLALSKDAVPAEKELNFAFTVEKAWWQTIWFRVMVALLVAGLLWVLVYWRFKARNSRLEMERKMLEAERKALRAQMNPHFIFNSLLSIQNFLAQNDRKSAYTYLARFGKLMRSILENSDKTYVPIEEELTVLRLYLQMEALRADHSFQYEIMVDKKLNPLSDEIPPMLLQPYVENAIWHGVMPLKEGGRIEVELRQEAEGVVCRIEDNGIGREAASEQRHKSPQAKTRSFGTRITEERLGLMNSSRRRNITVVTTDLKDETGKACGTRVELIVPMIKQE